MHFTTEERMKLLCDSEATLVVKTFVVDFPLATVR